MTAPTAAELRAVADKAGASLFEVLSHLDHKPLPDETRARIAHAVDALGLSVQFPFVLGASALTQEAP